MKITVEISLYPFQENYGPLIKDFIKRLKEYQHLEISTNATSTQIVGEHKLVFEILSRETENTFSEGKAAFIMKVIGFERDLQRNYN